MHHLKQLYLELNSCDHTNFDVKKLCQKADEKNLAESFAVWALRAAIRRAMSRKNGDEVLM